MCFKPNGRLFMYLSSVTKSRYSDKWFKSYSVVQQLLSPISFPSSLKKKMFLRYGLAYSQLKWKKAKLVKKHEYILCRKY